MQKVEKIHIWKAKILCIKILIVLILALVGYAIFSTDSQYVAGNDSQIAVLPLKDESRPVVIEEAAVSEENPADELGIGEQPETVEESAEPQEDEHLIEQAYEEPMLPDIHDEIAKIIESTEDPTFDEPETINESQPEIKPEEKSGENTAAKEEPAAPAKKLIAIVIDDMGINKKRTAEINEIKAPITASFLTYGTQLAEQVQASKDSGHEIILHIPMEPYSAANTAPDQLLVKMSNEQIADRFEEMLQKIDGLKGGNNHMGSRFTENREKLAVVMKILKEKNMFFLDSKTSVKAVGCEVAAQYDVDCANRDVFLDNENNFEYITGQLKRTERIAQNKGYAIAIGHPKSETVKALQNWLKNLDKDKFETVTISELLKKMKNTQKKS